MRKEIQERLAMASAIAKNPATVFCVQPFAAVENDGGERLGKLLARMMSDPDRAVLVTTGNSFVFAFGDQLKEDQEAPSETGATDQNQETSSVVAEVPR